jgi:ribosomal protein S18 acetylase RimI-like enzyme
MVASSAGDVIGSAIVLFRACFIGVSVARLYSLVVMPVLTCRGIATALLCHAEAVAAMRGAKAIRLEVRCDNHRAIGLYRKADYREIGVRHDYYCDGTDALRMEKRL